jgi:ribosomal protein S18 acetylase RimI-like enzyme
MSDLTIRSATAGEEGAVIALWQACGLVVAYNDPIADFRFAKDSPCSDILVGLDPAGEIKASVMVGYDGHRGWLYYVAVDPDVRHNGFGRQIIDAAEDWLRQRGVAKAQLMVRDTNTAVVSFYERLGFEVAPRVVMAKWLDEKQ